MVFHRAPVPVLLAALCFVPVVVAQSFSVAEVKPHFQCKTPDGQDRVRDHISRLVSNSTGIITLIQFEFTLTQPEQYTVFGASCTNGFSDPVVVLVNKQQFTVISGFRETIVDNYKAMPFLATGQPINGSMCVADSAKYGLRGYTGGVLRHTSSGKEICIVAGTFPHCRGSWQSQFLDDIEQGCRGRPLVVIADTNAACELEGPAASKKESMQTIGEHHHANWGTCSDPAIQNDEPTCCHDLSQGHPEARSWYDRIAICGGGIVDDFQVNADFVCGANEEHKYTTAMIHLASEQAAVLV
jgi:hypothetical protein